MCVSTTFADYVRAVPEQKQIKRKTIIMVQNVFLFVMKT